MPSFSNITSQSLNRWAQIIFNKALTFVLEFKYVIMVALGLIIVAFILEKAMELKIVRLLITIIFMAAVVWLLIWFLKA